MIIYLTNSAKEKGDVFFMATFDVNTFNVKEFDRILLLGLSRGLGVPGEQVCVEAAICQTLGLPHGDDPGCVAATVREFKIRLNDSKWTSPKARAKGLRDLGLAQLGSKGTISDQEFVTRLAEKTIRMLLPTMIRDCYPRNEKLLELAEVCEKVSNKESANALYDALAAVYASYASYAASSAAKATATAAYAKAATKASAAFAASYAASSAAKATATAAYADAASYAATAASAAAKAATKAAYAASAAAKASAAFAASYAASAASDKYLILEANLALEVLHELKSPGCKLLEQA